MKKLKKLVKNSVGNDLLDKETIQESYSTLLSYTKSQVSFQHPDYNLRLKEWVRVRDCMSGEQTIKSKKEIYLPRPGGMTGTYSTAYDSYIERAHFPLICPYALSSILGVILTKLPKFVVPKSLEYILETATKDGRSINQLFVDMIIDIFQTGRVPLLIDIIPKVNEFRFVQYKAENLLNWAEDPRIDTKGIVVGVLEEYDLDIPMNLFNSSKETIYKVLHLDKNPNGENVFRISVFGEGGSNAISSTIEPSFMGKTIDEIPIFMAGSINNSFNIQPIPMISVANCAVQIYRKEADLANSEFLSCNPTLVVSGASNDGSLPNVVGSSVMIVIPNELGRVYYTKTDTAALTHVASHIEALYDEAIRHGAAILAPHKGVEAAEALRIRMSTQSASLYSVYLSAQNSIVAALKLMCKWSGLNPNDVDVEAPTSLTFGIPDSNVMAQLISGFASSGIFPLEVVHKYLVASGLIDQTISIEDYRKMLFETKKFKDELNPAPEIVTEQTVPPSNTNKKISPDKGENNNADNLNVAVK